MTNARVGAAAAVLGALTWAAWLSWGFYPDRAYGTGQVLACAGTAVILTIILTVLGRSARPLVVAWCFAAGLCAAWTVWAFQDDESGLALVGSIMMLVGAGAGLSIVEVLTRSALPHTRTGR